MAVIGLGGAAILLWQSAGDAPAAQAAAMAPAPVPIASAPEPVVEPDMPAKPRTREEKRFARADRDDDGRITRDEYLVARRRNYDKLDSDGDGRLSFAEYAASGIDKFTGADTDGDGRLIPAEFATTAPKARKTAARAPCPPAEPGGDASA